MEVAQNIRRDGVHSFKTMAKFIRLGADARSMAFTEAQPLPRRR
ncbi:MAG: hypothetical protein NT115_06710 [Proteobacteria bacterium]|nr:hypothetical protein [Pseudomonadota bacterium]